MTIVESVRSICSHVSILIDIASMKLFVWVLGQLFAWAVDPNGGVLDSHLFFYDRYSDLALFHRRKRRIARARKFTAIAEAFYQAAPDDDEPPKKAAAMAMPIPRPPVNMNAVSTIRIPKRGADRSSGLLPVTSS